ncbi:Ribosome recycling factor [hydrothermal vent metagenome]|uniref:Ribosome recycling factor n=1 Tax=hydrothermal vent metagenome TaxID=652676 RepID=A0A3B0TIU9_9ZZZZ
MNYDFSLFKNKIIEVENWLLKEFSSIHTGRAVPALLDGVAIDSYGAKTAINHVASVTTEDPRTLRVSPWDKSQIKDIEKAINDANLGVSVASDDQGLRVFFPELTTERRQAFVKIAREKLEDARVSFRKEREEVWGDIQKKEKDGEISEDDKFHLKDELQKIMDDENRKLEEMSEAKEREIMS